METLYVIFKVVLTITAILMLLVVCYAIISTFIISIKQKKFKQELNKILSETIIELVNEEEEKQKSNSIKKTVRKKNSVKKEEK